MFRSRDVSFDSKSFLKIPEKEKPPEKMILDAPKEDAGLKNDFLNESNPQFKIAQEENVGTPLQNFSENERLRDFSQIPVIPNEVEENYEKLNIQRNINLGGKKEKEKIVIHERNEESRDSNSDDQQ